LIYFLILSVSLLQVRQAPNQKYSLPLVLAGRLADPYLVVCNSKIKKEQLIKELEIYKDYLLSFDVLQQHLYNGPTRPADYSTFGLWPARFALWATQCWHGTDIGTSARTTGQGEMPPLQAAAQNLMY